MLFEYRLRPFGGVDATAEWNDLPVMLWDCETHREAAELAKRLARLGSEVRMNQRGSMQGLYQRNKNTHPIVPVDE